MIGFLRGILTVKAPPSLVIDVNGVGYELEAPMSTCFALPDIGDNIQIVTHLVVREDQHTLYGFATEAERKLFRDLLKVNRVGAKLALGILSGISVEGFIRCVQDEDQTALSKLPGVGRKTAERLILDMRDRIDEQINILSISPVSDPGSTLIDATKRKLPDLIRASVHYFNTEEEDFQALTEALWRTRRD